jgi:hypothetical protein
VAVVQDTGPGEEVDVAPAVRVVEAGSRRTLEDGGEGPDVAPDLGFTFLEELEIRSGNVGILRSDVSLRSEPGSGARG